MARNGTLRLTAFAAVLSGLAAGGPAQAQQRTGIGEEAYSNFFENAPEGFIPPPLHPEGVRLRTEELGEGVYALFSDHPGVDNSGFIVGERGVLVIDAHINGEMARQIQSAVSAVTDRPILYLVNTNYHGDHTFGNSSFPAETKIIAHRATAERMRRFEHEREFLLPTVNGDTSVYADATLRLPDITFEESLRIDLGGRVVEVWHFGRGNTPGDTVVYAPDAKAAWTGNLVVGEGSIAVVFEGRTSEYLATIARFAGTLDVRTIVPGHGFKTTGATLGRYMAYLSSLLNDVRRAFDAGWTEEETVAALSLEERWLPAADSQLAALRPFFVGLHRLNVQQTYLDLAGR